jgi:hypothetical protein
MNTAIRPMFDDESKLTRKVCRRAATFFLDDMQKESLATVGIYSLIKALITLAPNSCMHREEIHAALRPKKKFIASQVDYVINHLLGAEEDGTFYCPEIDDLRLAATTT